MFPKVGPSGNGKLRVGRAVALLICVAAAAGCSSSSSPSSSASSSSPAAAGSSTTAPATSPSTSLSPAVAGPPSCATSGLNVTLGAPSGYAGGVDQTIVFTNTSGATCTLYGYPGVSLVTAAPYNQIGLAAQRSPTVPVTTVTLATGATAHAVVQIVNALNFGSSTCSPTEAAFLRVYPPNQTAPVYLANTSQTCAQPVQTLSVTAVQAGSGATS